MAPSMLALTVFRSSRRRRRAGRALPALSMRVLSVAALVLGAACQSDSLKPLPDDEGRVYWDLELNHHAVLLSTAAPYDTLQLIATPRDDHDQAVLGDRVIEYASTDVEHVLVLSDGVLRAVAPTSQPILVTATLRVGNVRHDDSVYVTVVDNPSPPTLTTFSVHPIPPDSAKVAVHSAFQLRGPLTARALDAGGQPIPDVLVSFRSSDPTVAEIDPTSGQITGHRPGSVTIYAGTTVFGVVKADTLPYRIGWPLFDIINGPDYVEGTPNRFSPTETRVGVGAYILWLTGSDTVPVVVTFDDPSAVAPATDATFFPINFCANASINCEGGNFTLGPHGGDQFYAARSFPRAGVYTYHSADGTPGRVVVIDDNAQ